MSVVSPGYLTLRWDDVKLEPWRIQVGDGVSEYTVQDTHIEDWTYYSEFTVRVSVEMDLPSVLKKLGLAGDAVLGALVTWTSDAGIRGVSNVVRLDNGENPIQVQIDAAQLRGQLRLQCQVVLREHVVTPVSKIAPSRAGSVLWQSDWKVRLEGLAPRFPAAPVPFSKVLGRSNEAMWWLQVGRISDLDDPADGILWLWLNSENSLVQEMLASPNDPLAQRTLMLMKLDVTRQLIRLGLELDQLDLGATYAQNSIGQVLDNNLRLLGNDLDSIRAEQKGSPSTLDARIQSAFGAR